VLAFTRASQADCCSRCCEIAGVVARLLVLLLSGFGCWCCIANVVWLEFLGEDGS
jgi:hypothetical protein